MESLIHNMSIIWKLEDKIFRADLGFRRFQFNFQNEKDLREVVRNGPYHFDSWTGSVERWKLVVASSYPSDIVFWVTIRDPLFHL